LFENVGLFSFDLVHESVDGADLGKIARADNNTNTGTLGYKRCTEGHVMSITKRNLAGIDIIFKLYGIYGLLDGERLSGEGRFGAVEIVHRKHA
jgi:hypothetical protein